MVKNLRQVKKFLTSTWAAGSAIALTASPVFAQTINLKPKKDTGFEPLGSLDLAVLISNLIKLLLVVASLVFFFWLVLGGIKWIMSGGDKAKTEEARSQITAALVGLVIVFSAWAIAQLINALFKVNILELNLSF